MSTVTGSRFISCQNHQQSSRRLLRALLRECSYLPDPACQIYIKKHVLYRFRHVSKRGNALLKQAGNETPEHDPDRKELQRLLHKGYRELHALIRANEGESKPLLRAMRHTYGRTGPRRYELMRGLLRPDDTLPKADTTVLGISRKEATKSPVREGGIITVKVPRIFQAPKSVKGDTMQYTISPRFSKLKSLVESHSKMKATHSRPRLKTKLSIPTKNTWGRQMPRVRVRNMAARKYAELLSTIMPPLPEKDWVRLEGLSLGTLPWEGCKPRRKRPAGYPEFLSASDLEKLVHSGDETSERIYLDVHIKKPSISASTSERITEASGRSDSRGYWRSEDSWLANDDARDDAFEEVLKDEMHLLSLNKDVGRTYRGHAITARFMRRLWYEVFQSCPLLQRNEQDQRWHVIWGAMPKSATELESSTQVEELFGTDAGSRSQLSAKLG